jgi:hypothetical protein
MHHTLLLLVMSVSAFAASVTETYESGNLKATYVTNKAGDKHGRYEEYFDAKKKSIKLIAAYKNGQLNGVLVERDEKGRLIKQEAWIDGVLEIPMGMDYIKQERAAIKVWAKDEVEKVYDSLVKGDFAPVAAGRPEKADMIAALARLNEYRLICGLSRVGIDLDKQRKAQGAVIVCAALGKITHTPDRPAGVTDDAWSVGQRGCAESNLAVDSAQGSIDQYINDSTSEQNRAQVGHRRWCLLPGATSVGIGASGGKASLAVATGESPDAVASAYPPSGVCPMDLAIPTAVWSYSGAAAVGNTMSVSSGAKTVSAKSYAATAPIGAPCVLVPEVPGIAAGAIFRVTIGQESYSVRFMK